MSNVVPQLVYDRETGKICIMIKMGSDMAVQDLPDDLSVASEPELKRYLESVVPAMMEGLLDKRDEKRRTIWKKAKEC